MYIAAIAIFFISYVTIISERVHRTTVALAGAVSMIAVGILHQDEAIAAIDFNTIGLLIGMMIIVSITRQTGLFQYVAIHAAKFAKGNPIVILVYLSVITALFSSVLDNVTTILLIGPVTFVITDNLKVNPIPFIITEIIMANLGGLSSLIGDPVNILIGSASGLSFTDFLFNLGPIVLLLVPAVLFFIYFKYRKQLKTTEELQQSIMRLDPAASIVNHSLLKKCLFVLTVTILGFLMHSVFDYPPATIALFGASLLLVISNVHPEEILEKLEWTTIMFFVGLFTLVAGLEKVGFIGQLSGLLLDATGGSQVATTLAIFWGSGLFSGLVDNLPFVATMIPLVQELGVAGLDIEPLWWVLAMGAVLGGNATIIGASTNLVGSGLAERSGYKISFLEFFKTGSVVVLICMSITTAYIFLRYL